MRRLIALLGIAIVAFAGYTFYQRQVAPGSAKNPLDALRDHFGSKPPSTERTVAVSSALQPFYRELFSELNSKQPFDLVPPLELAQDRLLALKAQSDAPEKQKIYEEGARLLAAMTSLAEERTKALEAELRGLRGGRASLDSPYRKETTGQFFAATAVKNWEEEKQKRQPALDQQLSRLRAAEEEWNQQLSEGATSETYTLPAATGPVVNIKAPADYAHALDKKPTTRPNTYPWRRAYYEQHGYPKH